MGRGKSVVRSYAKHGKAPLVEGVITPLGSLETRSYGYGGCVLVGDRSIDRHSPGSQSSSRQRSTGKWENSKFVVLALSYLRSW